MKRLLAIIISVSLILSCCTVGAFTAVAANDIWDGATITEPADSDSDGIKEIGTAAEFAWLGANGGSGSYILTADIYLNDLCVSWSEDTAVLTRLDGTAVSDASTLNVWSTGAAFTGTLDGNGHTVSGMYNAETVAVSTSSRHAMFTSGVGATVKNLRVSNTCFEGATYQGVIFAYNSGSGVVTIENCYVDNAFIKCNLESITNSCYPTAGGVVGYVFGTGLTVTNTAVNNLKVIGDDREGAFLGDAWASGDISVTNSYNATSYPAFGGSTGSASAYKGTMTSSAVYSATANKGSVAPSVITVSTSCMEGSAAAEHIWGIGDNFYTTETYPIQKIFLDEIDPAVNIQLGTVPAATSGVTIAGTSETYRTAAALSAFPLTWEATIKVDADAVDRPGIVVGNYSGSAVSAGVEIRDGGHPSLWIQPSSSGGTKYNFTNVDLRTGEKLHLAVTVDFSAKTATCYINGVAMQTISIGYDAAPAITNVMCIGGDLRSGNGQYLKQTEIYNVALYSDIRTAEEIASDAAKMDKADESLIAGYDFTAKGGAILTDLSLNNNHLVYTGSKTFEEGTRFTTYDRYVTEEIPSALPITVEADLEVDPDAPATRLYTIFGNYSVYNSSAEAAEAFNFEIRPNGTPYIYLQKAGNVRQTFTFSNIDLRKEGRCHLAVTLDYDTNTLYCYVNGVLRQTIVSSSDLLVPEINKAFGIGRDVRSEDDTNYSLQYTQLYSVAAYSDIRTADEIDQDMWAVNSTDKDLLFAYDLSSDSADILTDLSANSNDLVYTDLTPPPTGGVEINTNNYYLMSEALSSFPKTVEAEIYLSRTFADDERGGVIAGNYSGSAKGVVNLEIYTNGQPRLYIVLENGTVINTVFSDVDVRTGMWLKLAVVYDEDAGTLTCYVDGEAKQTKSITAFTPFTPSSAFYVGTDYRGISQTSFKGKINGLYYFSDTRSAAEIAADASGVDVTDENLMAAYDLSDGYQKDIADSSGNGNDLICQGTYYLDETPTLDDYAYSFAVVGDTQIVTQRYPDKLANIYDWILDNAETYNIQHVFGMGDITNGDSDTEWNTALTQINKMNGKLSYSLVRGNHDSKSQFDKYLGGENTYTAQYDGEYEAGSALNTYQYLTVGKTDYLIFNLDYGFDDNVIAWASEIIEDHPNHNVIITTHAYLYRDGTTLDDGDVCPPSKSGGVNDGDDMWDKFISKHENIVLVMNGHDPCARIVTTQTEGENGNVVTQMLIDPQGLDADSSIGPTGMVTMLYFSEDGKTVQVRNYSTIQEKYFGKQNQYTITVDKVDPTLGDANDDGKVDIFDLVTVTNVIDGKDVSYNANTADVNGDNVIDKLDLAEIRKMMIGKR